MAIGISHGGSNVYASAAPAKEVLVGTKDGVVLIERDAQGSGWHVAHRDLPGQHISSIIVERESGTIFAGAFFGTVHASTDGGRTWERRDNGMTLDDVYSLASVKMDGKVRVYAGTQPAHLFYSEDLGLHWTELPSMRDVASVDKWSFPAPPHIAHTKFISFDPHDPDTVFSCIEQGALLKSTDAGKTWRELNTLGFYRDKGRASEVFYDIHKTLIDPRDPKKMFVTGGAGLYVTFNEGEQWERWMCPDWAADVYPDGLVHNPRNPDIMFVSAAAHNPARWRDAGTPGYSGSRIYRSIDAGRTWETLGPSNGLPDRMQQEVGGLCLEDWGDSFSVFAATTAGEVFVTDDGGDHWSLAVSGLGAISKKGHEAVLSSVSMGPMPGAAQPVRA